MLLFWRLNKAIGHFCMTVYKVLTDLLQDIDQTFEGDNSVMMQQVSKALLDTASSKPPQPVRPQIQGSSSLLDAATILKLLQFR